MIENIRFSRFRETDGSKIVLFLYWNEGFPNSLAAQLDKIFGSLFDAATNRFSAEISIVRLQAKLAEGFYWLYFAIVNINRADCPISIVTHAQDENYVSAIAEAIKRAKDILTSKIEIANNESGMTTLTMLKCDSDSPSSVPKCMSWNGAIDCQGEASVAGRTADPSVDASLFDVDGLLDEAFGPKGGNGGNPEPPTKA